MIKQTRIIFVVVAACLIMPVSMAVADLHKNKSKEGSVYWHGDSVQNMIALTFDDGPQEIYTPQILDVLKKYNVKATFFLIGKNVENYPELTKRIVDEGHGIGNHTYDHPDLRLQNQRQIKQQLEKTERAIINVTGAKTHLFRPPYGVDSNASLREIESSGYTVVKWSVSGLNGRQDAPFDKIVHRVVDNVQNGSIILLHDGNRLSNKTDRSQIVKALPVIIETLLSKGYRFVTIDELLLREEVQE
jgi:peptidoglycan/xylan/chitin deacetylase (PgdA/CDA1 family)